MKFNRLDEVRVNGYEAKLFPYGGLIGNKYPICGKQFYFVSPLRHPLNPFRIFEKHTWKSILIEEKDLE